MVRKDHTEQVSVGDRPESGSILIEGGAAFDIWGVVIVRVACLALAVGCARLDLATEAVGEVVVGDLVGIDVELGEDTFGDGALHVIAATAVEAGGSSSSVAPKN